DKGDASVKSKKDELTPSARISLRAFYNRLDALRQALTANRATFRVGERDSYIELESGRVYDAVLNRFFVRQGDVFVEDGKAASEDERAEISEKTSKTEKDKDKDGFLRQTPAPNSGLIVPATPDPMSSASQALAT